MNDMIVWDQASPDDGIVFYLLEFYCNGTYCPWMDVTTANQYVNNHPKPVVGPGNWECKIWGVDIAGAVTPSFTTASWTVTGGSAPSHSVNNELASPSNGHIEQGA